MADAPQWFADDGYMSDSSIDSIPVVGDELVPHLLPRASNSPDERADEERSGIREGDCAICTRLSTNVPLPVYPPRPPQPVRSAVDMVSLVAAYAHVADSLYVAQVDLRAAHEELQAHTRDLHRGISVASAQAREFLAFCESRYAQANHQLDSRRVACELLTAELVHLQESFEDTQHAHQEDRERLLARVSALQTALDNSQAETDDWRSRATVLEGVLQDVVAGHAQERDRLRAEVQSLNERLAQNQTLLGIAESHVGTSDSAQSYDARVGNLEAQLRVVPAMQADILRLQRETQVLSAALAAIDDDRRRAESERDEQAVIAAKRSSENVALQADVARLEANLLRFSDRHHHLSVVDDLRRELGQLRAAAAITRDRARRQARRHLATISVLRTELAQARADAAAEQSRLAQVHDGLIREVLASRTALASVEAERDARSGALQQLRRAFSGIQATEAATLRRFRRVSARFHRHVLATSAAVRADRERLVRERDLAVAARRDLERQVLALQHDPAAVLQPVAPGSVQTAPDSAGGDPLRPVSAASPRMSSSTRADATQPSLPAGPATAMHQLDAVIQTSAADAAAVLTCLAAEVGTHTPWTTDSSRGAQVRHQESPLRSAILAPPKRARLTPLPEAVSGLPGTYRMPRAILRPGQPRRALRMQALPESLPSDDDREDGWPAAAQSPTEAESGIGENLSPPRDSRHHADRVVLGRTPLGVGADPISSVGASQSPSSAASSPQDSGEQQPAVPLRSPPAASATSASGAARSRSPCSTPRSVPLSPASSASNASRASDTAEVSSADSGRSPQRPFALADPIPGSSCPVRFRPRDVTPWPAMVVSATTLGAVTEDWLHQLVARPGWLFPLQPIAKPAPTSYNPELATWSQISAMLDAEPWSVLEPEVPPVFFSTSDPDFAPIVAEFTYIRETWAQAYWESTHFLPLPPDGDGDPDIEEYVEQRRQRRSRLGARWKVLLERMADLMQTGRCDVDLLLDPHFMLLHPRSSARYWYPVEDPRPDHGGNLLYALALLDQREPWRNQFRDNPARHPGHQFDRIVGKFCRPASP